MTEEVSTTNGEDFDLLVRRKTGEMQPLLRRMEETRLQFVSEVVRFTVKWYGDTARFYVEKQSEITLHMSKEKLASMKSSVNSLIGSAEEKVNTALSKPDVWWHISPAKNQQLGMYEQLDNRYPEVVDKAVRRALGELGRILEQFGYRVSIGGPNKWSYPEFWFETHKQLGTAVQPFYPLLLEWSEKMQEIIGQYNEIYKQALPLFNEIEKLKEEKKKQQARSLWDST